MFLTDKARFEDYNKDIKLSLDNVLYKANDGTIYLCPRNFCTDLYTIPNCLSWLVGDSAGRDTRPALLHDWGCVYHSLLKVGLTEEQLLRLGFLHLHYSDSRQKHFLVCENIPRYYLSLVPVSKGEINDLFGEMMESLDISRRHLIRFGVCFNVGWYLSKYDFNWDNLYKLDNKFSN